MAPKERVTDFRTQFSGVRRADVSEGKRVLAFILTLPAPSFEAVQQRVAEILKGRIVVGHALSNDFKATAPLYGAH